MQVKNIAGIGFTTRRAAHEQRDLAIGLGVLAQVVVDDQRVLALFHELFADGAAGIGRNILQGGRVGSGRRNHDGVIHRAVLLQGSHQLHHLGAFLTDGHVNANQVLALLIDDRINRNGRLAGLAVADDQLALAATDGNQSVNGLDAGLHRRIHRLAGNDVGRDALYRARGAGVDRAFAVQRLTQRVDHAADQGVAHRHRHDAAGGTNQIAFFDFGVLTQDDDTDAVLFQVEDDAHGAVGEFDQLAGQGIRQALDAGDAIAHFGDGAHVHHARRRFKR